MAEKVTVGPSSSDISGLKECGPCTNPDPYQQPCSWTVRVLTSSLGGGPTVLRALAHCGPLCLTKQ